MTILNQNVNIYGDKAGNCYILCGWNNIHFVTVVKILPPINCFKLWYNNWLIIEKQNTNIVNVYVFFHSSLILSTKLHLNKPPQKSPLKRGAVRWCDEQNLWNTFVAIIKLNGSIPFSKDPSPQRQLQYLA